MKQFLLIFLLLPFTLIAQQTFPVDTVSGKITYTDVVSVEGVLKANLYTRAKEWFGENFSGPEATIEKEDKEAGILIGKAYKDIQGMSTTGMEAIKLWYNVKVEVKDNRYRYTIDNINLQNYVNSKLPAPEMQNQLIPGGRFLLHSDITSKGKTNQPLIAGKKKAATILEGLATSLKEKMTGKSGS